MRLKEISVRGLFGRFDHTIPTNLEERITILTGANGSGKTMTLRMLHSLFAQPSWALAKFPYKELQADFDTGSRITVQRIAEAGSNSEKKGRTELTVRYEVPGSDPALYSPRSPSLSPGDLPFPPGIIDELIPELDQISPNLWRPRGTNEKLTLDDVLERYWDELPMGSAQATESSAPDWLKELKHQIPVRFIQTDRLYDRRTRTRRPDLRWQYHVQTGAEPVGLAVNRYSQDLAEKIRQTLADYGELAQKLDRSFPQRVVNQNESSISLSALQKELDEIEKRRSALVSAGLLVSQEEYWPMPIAQQDIDASKRGVLSVYVRDAKQKLDVFRDLLSKVELYREIINAKFLDKRVQVSQAGFAVVGSDGKALPLNLLSSGEQHELVLFYELLFNVSRNSLILIDEPEISLHVEWQEAFLEDLSRVAGIAEFDAIVATHSPQIINTHWNLAVELAARKGKVRATTDGGPNREQHTP